MKTALQAANDLLYVMKEVGQADCYLDDMRLIITELNRLNEEIAATRTVLRVYGHHKTDCHRPFTGICDCGFSKVNAA